MPSMKSVAARAVAFVFGHVVLVAAVAWFAGSVSQANANRTTQAVAPFVDVDTTGTIRR